jgi:hypothetical protein
MHYVEVTCTVVVALEIMGVVAFWWFLIRGSSNPYNGF